MEKYYIVEFKGADPQGPFELTEIQARIGYGEITPMYMYREENGYEWKPIYELPDVEELFDEEMLAIVKKPLPPIPPKKPIPAGLPAIPASKPKLSLNAVSTAAAWEGGKVSSAGTVFMPGNGSVGMIAGGIVYFIVAYIAMALSIEEASSSAVFGMMMAAFLVGGGAMVIKMLMTFVPGSAEKDKGNSLYGIIIALPIMMVIFAMIDADTRNESVIARRLFDSSKESLMYAFVVVVTLLFSAVMRIRRDAIGNKESGFVTPLFYVLACVLTGGAFLVMMGADAEVGIHCGCVLTFLAFLLLAYKLGDSGFSGATLAWAMCCFFVLPLWGGWLLPELFEGINPESSESIIYMSSWLLLPICLTTFLLGARLASDDKEHRVSVSMPSMGWVPLVATAILLTVPEWINSSSGGRGELSKCQIEYMELLSLSMGCVMIIVLSALLWGAVWGTASFVYSLLSRNKWSVMLNGLIACTVGVFAHYLLSGLAAVSSLNANNLSRSFADMGSSGHLSSYGRIFDDDFLEPWFYSNINMLVIFVIVFLVIANRESSR